MPGLKRWNPGIRFAGIEVTPEEIDRYETYQVVFPGDDPNWFGTTVVAGTSATKALVIRNAIADYPRNLLGAVAGSAAGLGGTWTVNGKDQFGNSITETLTVAEAQNGGTTVGTKVFAQVTSGTFNFGTAVGNGTTKLGMATAGTTTLFGLPAKIAGTGDVKLLALNDGTGAITVGGGTIGAFVNAGMHAVKAPKDVVGTTTISVWYKPTYDAESEAKMANLTQV